MKGFTTGVDNNASSIDYWTIKECKEYLDNYPKGLKAEKVKRRIGMLQGQSNGIINTIDNDNKSTSCSSKVNVRSQDSNKSVHKPSHGGKKYKGKQAPSFNWTLFWKVMGTIGLFALMITATCLGIKVSPSGGGFVGAMIFFACYYGASKLWD